MKKSQIALLATVGLIIVMVIVYMGVFRNPSGLFVDKMEKSDDGISRSLNLSGFDTVNVENYWEVHITKSSEFSVKIYYPQKMENRIQVKVKDQKIILDVKNGKKFFNAVVVAEISMPQLSRIESDGVSNIEFSGFDEDELSIRMDGIGTLSGFDSHVNRLKINLDGVSHIDFTDVQSVNARIELDGVGDVRLAMNGGVLEGTIDGPGKIVYAGTVTDERIVIDGPGRVRIAE